MRSGLLRHRVTLQRRKLDKDNRGQTTEQWLDVATVFAQVVQNNGREQIEGLQKVVAYDYRVHVRTIPGIQDVDRLVYHHAEGDKTLDILAKLDRHQRGRWLELVCKEHER